MAMTTRAINEFLLRLYIFNPALLTSAKTNLAHGGANAQWRPAAIQRAFRRHRLGTVLSPLLRDVQSRQIGKNAATGCHVGVGMNGHGKGAREAYGHVARGRVQERVAETA